jgi:hypothetical protein
VLVFWVYNKPILNWTLRVFYLLSFLGFINKLFVLSFLNKQAQLHPTHYTIPLNSKNCKFIQKGVMFYLSISKLPFTNKTCKKIYNRINPSNKNPSKLQTETTDIQQPQVRN